MLRDSIKRAFIVFMMFAVINMFLGCNDSKDVIKPELSVEPGEYSKSNNNHEVFDFTTCDGSTYQIFNQNVQFYTPGFDPDDRIYQVSNKSCVQKQIQYFMEQGYEFRPEHSLVISGTVVPEGMTDTFNVEVVELVMAYVEDTMKQVVHVSYTECEKLGYAIQSSITSFVPPEDIDGYNEILMGQDGNQNNVFVWVKDFEPNIAYKATPSIATGSLTIDYWACVLMYTLIGCIVGAIVCLVTGPGWLACAMWACAVSAIASAICCAIDMFF